MWCVMQDDSEVRDTTTHGEVGVMCCFKPMTMPERPAGLEFAGEDEIQVAQVCPPSLFACSTEFDPPCSVHAACLQPAPNTTSSWDDTALFSTAPPPQTDAFMYAYANTTAAVNSEQACNWKAGDDMWGVC